MTKSIKVKYLENDGKRIKIRIAIGEDYTRYLSVPVGEYLTKQVAKDFDSQIFTIAQSSFEASQGRPPKNTAEIQAQKMMLYRMCRTAIENQATN